MHDFIGIDAETELLDQSGLGPLDIGERPAANDLVGARVGHAQHNGTTALVRQGSAILYELLEMKVALRFLEFEMLVLFGVQPVF
jgi:hypothetical protein